MVLLRLSVSFGAVANAENPHAVVFEGKQDAIVSQAKPECSGHIAMRRVDIARAGASETKNAFEQVHRRCAIDGANVGTASSSHSIL